MSTQSGFNNISLYIPHVFPNFTKEDVASVFEEKKIGKVARVDFVSKMGQDGKYYNSAYIHFDFWCDTISTRNFQANVCDPKQEARVVYDEPWFWIVLENKGNKHVTGERKPRIDLSDFAPKQAAAKQPSKLVLATSWSEVIEPKPRAVALAKPAAKPVVVQVKVEPVKEEVNPHQTAKEDDNDFQELVNDIAKLVSDADMDMMSKDVQQAYSEFEAQQEQMYSEMEDCDEDDKNLVSIDYRYVQTLETENANMKTDLAQLHLQMGAYMQRISELEFAYQKEQIKTEALTELVQTLKK